MPRNIVIVGGVAGGASAAARLRRLNEEDHIVMLERGSHISFANCGLPYYIEETIQSRNKLFLQTPAGMGKRFRGFILKHEFIAYAPNRFDMFRFLRIDFDFSP